jgi:hypothetical protein
MGPGEATRVPRGEAGEAGRAVPALTRQLTSQADRED